jgi:hypothetical protein
MSQLMPEGMSPEENGATEETQLWTQSGMGEGEAKARVNIFEYAALRYSQLKTQSQRIGKSPARSVASADSSDSPFRERIRLR